eukprot:608681-Ditylum_brightwellii.AAC.1
MKGHIANVCPKKKKEAVKQENSKATVTIVKRKVPRGSKKYYPKDVVLLLLKAAYDIKQAVMVFWRELLARMKDMGYKRS